MNPASYIKTFFSTLTLEWIVVIAVVTVVLSIFMLYTKRKGRISAGRAVLFVILAVYMLTVFVSTVFSRVPKSTCKYTLILFWSYYEILFHGNMSLFWEDFGNLFMLMPFGFLLPFINPCGIVEKGKAARVTVLTGFLCTLAIELLQLILKRGLFEFDDIVHNTLGVGIGYALYRLFPCRK